MKFKYVLVEGSCRELQENIGYYETPEKAFEQKSILENSNEDEYVYYIVIVEPLEGGE